MEKTSRKADSQFSQDVRLMGPDIDIVQDIEQDLEDYSRLAKLGRFGEASVFFEEVLSRNLNCFAVLAEHCHALVDQGDFTNAELILDDCLYRQARFVRGSDCFEPDEKQLLRLLRAYVRICNGNNQEEAESQALIELEWSSTQVNVSNSTELTDVQRQIILVCLRIYGALWAIFSIPLERLRLPWSPRSLYLGETMTISKGYLTWFESLLIQHPWDANIILQQLDKLRAPSFYHQDYHHIVKMLDSALHSDLAISSEFFARMSLLATLYETALLRIWSVFNRLFPGTMARIGSSPETEVLIETIKKILHAHSKNIEVTRSRPYKRLKLLVIDDETLRMMNTETCQKITEEALAQLDTVERFAMNSNIHDHHLALQTMYRYCVLLPERDLRTLFLDKVARFTAHFGHMPEISSIQTAISDGTIPSLHHGRDRNSVLSCVLQARSKIDNLLENRSIIENIMHSIEARCRRLKVSTEQSSSSRTFQEPPDPSLDRYSPPRRVEVIVEESDVSSNNSDRRRASGRRSAKPPRFREPQDSSMPPPPQPVQVGVKFTGEGRESNISSRTQNTQVTQDSGYQSDHLDLPRRRREYRR